MAALAGKSVIIKISGNVVSMTAEATTNLGDNKTYRITNALKRVIDWDTQPIVKVGGSVTAEKYSIDYLRGTVIFATVNAGRGAVTLEGKYVPMSVAAYANSFNRSTECELLDATVFGNDYKNRIPGMLSASGSLTQIDVTDEIYLTALKAGKPVVIEDVAITGGEPNRVIAFLESIEESVDATALQSMSIGWTSKNKYLTLGV